MKDKQLKYDVNWAEVVDMLAHEYGWTIDYIQGLTLPQITKLITAMTNRYQAQAPNNNASVSSKKKSKKFQADDAEKQIGMMLAWGATKEIDKDGKERYIL